MVKSLTWISLPEKGHRCAKCNSIIRCSFDASTNMYLFWCKVCGISHYITADSTKEAYDTACQLGLIQECGYDS